MSFSYPETSSFSFSPSQVRKTIASHEIHLTPREAEFLAELCTESNENGLRGVWILLHEDSEKRRARHLEKKQLLDIRRPGRHGCGDRTIWEVRICEKVSNWFKEMESPECRSVPCARP